MGCCKALTAQSDYPFDKFIQWLVAVNAHLDQLGEQLDLINEAVEAYLADATTEEDEETLDLQ